MLVSLLNAPSFSYAITDDLLVYDVAADSWHEVSGGNNGDARFRHSAVLIDNWMLVFGGNAHNETAAASTNCYSSALLAFDLGM